MLFRKIFAIVMSVVWVVTSFKYTIRFLSAVRQMLLGSSFYNACICDNMIPSDILDSLSCNDSNSVCTRGFCLDISLSKILNFFPRTVVQTSQMTSLVLT